jgi:hypothetical protein
MTGLARIGGLRGATPRTVLATTRTSASAISNISRLDICHDNALMKGFLLGCRCELVCYCVFAAWAQRPKRQSSSGRKLLQPAAVEQRFALPVFCGL